MLSNFCAADKETFDPVARVDAGPQDCEPELRKPTVVSRVPQATALAKAKTQSAATTALGMWCKISNLEFSSGAIPMTAAFLFALVATSFSTVAEAAKDQDESVFVQIGGPPAAAAETQAAIVSALAPMAVKVKPQVVAAVDVAEIRSALAAPAGDPTWLAQVYIDSSGRVMTGAVTVFVVDWRHGRLFMRSLRQTGPTAGPLIREQVVQIVVAAVGSLLAGQRVGEDREQAEQKLANLQRPAVAEAKPAPTAAVAASLTPPQTTSPATVPAWLWSVALGYGARGAGGALSLQHGPTVDLAVQWERGAWMLGPMMRAAYLQGAERLDSPVALRLSQWPLWIGLSAGRRLTSHTLLHAAALGGIEPTVVRPAPADPQVMPAGQTTIYIPSMAAVAGLDVTLTRRLKLRVDVGVSVDASQHRLVIQTTNGPEQALTLGRIKPFGALAVVLAL